MEEKTKTVRLTQWVADFFSTKAKRDDKSFIKKMDETAKLMQLLDANEVTMSEDMQTAYKEDKKNNPRIVYETLDGLLQYSTALNYNFNYLNFIQFIDRFNIVAYYISAHIYTNQLSPEQLDHKEVNQRAQSSAALLFLFDKDIEQVLECINDIFEQMNPYDNACISKKTHATILSKIFENEKLMKCMYSKSTLKKEDAIVKLFKGFERSRDLKTDGKTIFHRYKLFSTGLTNKINYLMHKEYTKQTLEDLPCFVNEEFLADLFAILHSNYLHDNTTALYNAKSLQAAFKISYAIYSLGMLDKKEDHYLNYLKGNLQHANDYNNLKDALKADVNVLDKTSYTYSAEMRMRTPMQILENVSSTSKKYIRTPQMKELILENLFYLCYPIYSYVVREEGSQLYPSIDIEEKTFYSNDREICLRIHNNTEGNYINVQFRNFGEELIEFSSSISMKHSSLEKIYHCIIENKTYNVKIEKNLSFKYSDNIVFLSSNQNSIMLDGKYKIAFKEVIEQYMNSECFTHNKKYDLLSHGLM